MFLASNYMAEKPVFVVHISDETPSALEARVLLARATAERCLHTHNGLRMPLGIYNISVGRVTDKISRLSSKLENYFDKVRSVNPESQNNYDDEMQEVVDYIELALYAAAEHVDDIDSIATWFFKNRTLRDRDQAYRQLQKAIKKNKKFVAAAANAIKHQQSRIRIFSMEYSQASASGCLHGYFIEGVVDGVVGPSATFHRHQAVFSVNTLVWEIIVFLLCCSRDLATFLKSVVSEFIGPVRANDTGLSRALAVAVRLPSYTFGEEHPLSRVTLHIGVPRGGLPSQLAQALYGSLNNPWLKDVPVRLGTSISRYTGDGVSRSFLRIDLKNMVPYYWD
ncbi:hypothetical protein [uncultured Castellaniella sp.]|uniref:hypothetical protein n=1 Tax=uncultured Castellaniella sp. TaxID=647907 RepID=UPI0026187C0B|nr:hypothetical protein [uncultured Castellaniella sp.]